MRLHPHLVFIFLVLLVASFSVASGQRPSTFTLRQRITASDPGVPAVQVTVDQRRVPLGTMVTFMLRPAAVVRDPRYTVTLSFGDGKQQSVRATEIPHLYGAVGTYLYSVQVKANHQPPGVTLNATPIPSVTGQPVSFFAQTTQAYPNLRYRFSYGDGTTSGWQDSPQSSHIYPAAGKYSAYVDISDANQPFGGSPRKEIEIAGSSTSDPKPTPGPGSQPTPSNRPTPNNRPTPDSSPRSTPAPSPVGSPSPAVGGSPSPSPRPSGGTDNNNRNNNGSINGNNNSGNGNGNSNAGNDNGSIGAGSSTSPNGTTNSDPFGLSENWWKYLLIAALILFLIYQATGLLIVARPTFDAFSDQGVSDVAGKEHVVPIDFQMVLNRNVAAGDYAVETSESSLVRNSDQLGKRETLEI